MKENKEPSPKVKRRRSVKISSAALEPAQWQNDALQILTCTNDYRSMNDFLMKKVSSQVCFKVPSQQTNTLEFETHSLKLIVTLGLLQ